MAKTGSRTKLQEKAKGLLKKTFGQEISTQSETFLNTLSVHWPAKVLQISR